MQQIITERNAMIMEWTSSVSLFHINNVGIVTKPLDSDKLQGLLEKALLI